MRAEYTQLFYEEQSTILLAPWDSRSHIWDISKDVRTPEDVDLFVQCLLPISQDDKEKLWIQGAQIIFSTMILELIRTRTAWGWLELAEQLTLSEKEMIILIEKHNPHAKQLVQEQSKTTQGFYVHIISELSWIQTIAKAWPNCESRPFCIREWLPDLASLKTKIIIQSHSRFERVGAPLCSAFIAFLSRAYFAQEHTGRSTWLFIDEFANLPKNPSIKKWLELSRSKGARSVLCTQSPSQLRSIYGEADANTLMSLLSNIVTLRVSSGGNDAQEVASMFGEQEVEVPNYEEKERIGVRSKQAVVSETYLSNLETKSDKGVMGLLLIPGWESVYKLTWPFHSQQAIAPAVIEAEWVKVQPQTLNHSNKNRLNKRNK